MVPTGWRPRHFRSPLLGGIKVCCCPLSSTKPQPGPPRGPGHRRFPQSIPVCILLPPLLRRLCHAEGEVVVTLALLRPDNVDRQQLTGVLDLKDVDLLGPDLQIKCGAGYRGSLSRGSARIRPERGA